MKMNLIDRKKQLEQQREQLIAQVNQISGALAILDEMIKEESKDKEILCEDCEQEELTKEAA